MTHDSFSILSAAQGDAAATTRTFGEFLASGGELMVPIGICSVVVLGLTIERLLSLRRARVLDASTTAALASLRDGQASLAREALSDARCFAARVLAAGLRREGYAVADVEGAMEDQAQKEFDRMRRNIRPITLIGGIAPLLGLLGTVLGISEAFHQVSSHGMGKPEMLAGGIEVALTTTIAGLFVAIPAMILGSWLSARARHLVAFVDESLSPAVEQIAARPTTAPSSAESHAA